MVTCMVTAFFSGDKVLLQRVQGPVSGHSHRPKPRDPGTLFFLQFCLFRVTVLGSDSLGFGTPLV